MVDPGWYIFSWLWMGVLQVCWDVHGAACTPSWVCCREALRRDRDLYSHSRPHTWLSSATRYFYCLIDNETPRKYPLWHGDQSLHYVAPSFLHFLPSSLNACMEFVCWLFDDSFFFFCAFFVSPSQVIYQLCACPDTSGPTMRYLRTSQDFLFSHLQHLPFILSSEY